MVDISLNGEPRAVPPGQTVAALLASLGLDARKVAVERNEAIVVRSHYETTSLGAGDQIEIVHFIGGG
ncbi:MAG: sulfur carrier protein ThiS [Gemmatimonadaceae bacterium]|nr:sulfur carrier protein ThiS [Acetobacteraceae bacterium]